MRLLDALPRRLELPTLLELLAACPALHGRLPQSAPTAALTLATVAEHYLSPRPPRGSSAAASRTLVLLQSRLVRCAARREIAIRDVDSGAALAAAACKELQPLVAQHLDTAVAAAVGLAANMCFCG